jgi:hypothetical protein
MITSSMKYNESVRDLAQVSWMAEFTRALVRVTLRCHYKAGVT